MGARLAGKKVVAMVLMMVDETVEWTVVWTVDSMAVTSAALWAEK